MLRMLNCAAALIALALAGCQTPQQQRALQALTPAQRAQCEAQARMGGGNPNAFIAAFDMADIRNSCQAAAGLTNMEVLGQALGIRIEQGRPLSKNQRAQVGGFAEACGAQAPTISAFRERFAGPDMQAEWDRGRLAERGAPAGACAFARAAILEANAQPR